MSKYKFADVLYIRAIKAPTGRAKCKVCDEFIPIYSMKLQIARSFWKAGMKFSITSKSSVCKDCATSFLNRNGIKERFNKDTVMEISKKMHEKDMKKLKRNYEKEMNFVNGLNFIKEL